MKTTNRIIKTLFGAVSSLLVTFGLTRNPAALARILIIGLAVLAAAPSQAAKPGGGGTASGTIYYIGPRADATNGGTAVMTTINPDGSNKTQLGLGLFGTPSSSLHGGHRWFVSARGIAGQYYPDGSQKREIIAYRDDYDYATNSNASTRVWLTDDVTLEPSGADWVPGDLQISFIGRRWSSAAPGATVLEGGIYTASPVFGSDGNLVGLAAPPTTPAIPLPLVEPAPGDWQPDLLFYSWAPTGEMVAYSNSGDNELWVAGLLGARIRIYSGSAHMPQWSPAGNKIAFTSGGSGIWTINVDGTGAKRVIWSTSIWFFHHAKWSPDGRYLVFTGQPHSGQPQPENNTDLFRATASGGNLVQLTSTPAPFTETMYEFNGGWR